MSTKTKGTLLARAIQESIANISANSYTYNDKNMEIHKRYSCAIPRMLQQRSHVQLVSGSGARFNNAVRSFRRKQHNKRTHAGP